MMNMTTAVKHLLIINILLFAATWVFQSSLGIDLNDTLGLHFFTASDFRPWQFVTFIFMHASIAHIFSNMFGLWMFGSLIEQAIGTRRFIYYYFVCGIGSGILQQIATYFDVQPLISAVNNLLANMSSANIQSFMNQYVAAFSVDSQSLISTFINEYNTLIHSDPDKAMSVARTFLSSYQDMYVNAQVTVGASGAIFGILMAVALLFPNMRIMLLFPPIPFKAKWFVLFYGIYELFGGVANFQADHVAHWAHLGGLLFGFIMIRIWKIQRFN